MWPWSISKTWGGRHEDESEGTYFVLTFDIIRKAFG